MSDLDSHLRLKAVRAKDLEVISGALQDAIVPIGDISVEPGPGQFVFVANRFCWETTGDTKSSAPGSRVHAGVTFFNVVEVKRRGIDFRNRTTFLSLLAATCKNLPDREGPTIELIFSGDTGIRLETTELLCHLEDFGEPWPTQWRPQHADD
jgi:hypothetical protein